MPRRISAASIPCAAASRPASRQAANRKATARRTSPAEECGNADVSPHLPRAWHKKAACLFERVRLMAERGLRRNNQHRCAPIVAQAAGQRHVIHREQRRTHPFHRRDERRTRKRRARGKSRRSLQRHNRPICVTLCGAKGNDVAARAARQRNTPAVRKAPTRALRLGGQQLFKPPSPADRAFFHAQHVAGGGIRREQPPPRTAA